MTPLTQLLAAAALSVVICIALWQSRGAVDAKGVTVGGFAAFITAMTTLAADTPLPPHHQCHVTQRSHRIGPAGAGGATPSARARFDR